MNDSRKPRRCQVLLLDERRLDFLIQPRLMSCDLLDLVASHFSLHEKEYFGLTFKDDAGHQVWLRMDKKVLDHDLTKYEPVVLTFSVRFFVPNILLLKEAITVELFYMQAKALIFKGSVHCDSETVFELAGFVLQASYGDYTGEETARNDLKKTPVLPTRTLKEHPSISYCENKVLWYYERSAGQTRGESIVRYLSIFQSLPTYGVHYYEVKDKGSIPWWLGLSPRGIGVYDHDDKIKPRKVFQWNQIENIYFRDRRFSIEIRESYRYEYINRNRTHSLSRKVTSPSSMMIHAWLSSTSAQAKAMWTMAINQHQFYLDKRVAEFLMLLRSDQADQVEVAEVTSLGSSQDSISNEAKSPSHQSLKDVAKGLTQSTASISSSLTSDVSESARSDYSCSISSVTNSTTTNGGDNISITTRDRAAEQEMFKALSARKEALIDRLREKTEELRKLCIQEAELIGEYPPETPYNGNPLPPIRRKVKTAFEFSEFIVDGDEDFDDEEDAQLERDIEIQAAITSAAEKLAHDRKQNKSVRKSRKLSYQKSLRKLKTMEELLERRKRSPIQKNKEEEEQDKKSNDSLDAGVFLSHRADSPDGKSYEIVEKIAPHRYRHTLNINIRERKSSTGSFPDDEELDDEPRYFSAKDYPPSPSTRRYMDLEYYNGRMSNSRQGPAFPYSDSDTRSDSSTKLSSMSSSYGNSEELMDNSEPLRLNEIERSPYRRVAGSTDNLAREYYRANSPKLVVTRSTARSSESVFNDNDHDPMSPNGVVPFANRSFSCSGSKPLQASPKVVTHVTAKYLNSRDLGIVSNTGTAGSYSVNHGGSIVTQNAPGRSLGAKGSISTSMLSINRTGNNLRSRSHGNLNSAMNRQYTYYPNGLHRNRPNGGLSASDELLEWTNDETSEATLV